MLSVKCLESVCGGFVFEEISNNEDISHQGWKVRRAFSSRRITSENKQWRGFRGCAARLDGLDHGQEEFQHAAAQPAHEHDEHPLPGQRVFRWACSTFSGGFIFIRAMREP